MRSLAAVFVLSSLAAVPAVAEDSLHGTASFGVDATSFPRGLAIVQGRRVSVGFFTSAPGPEVEAAALRGGLCCVPWAGPRVVLDVIFKTGAAKADRSAVEACHIGYYGFSAGPLDHNGDQSLCGLVSIAGDLRAGGVVSGAFKGNGETQGVGEQPTRPYAWDLTFTATLRPAP